MPDLDVEVLKQEILSLLVSAKNGLTEHELLTDFRLFNSNRDLPYKELGYRSLIDLLRSWPDVCRVQGQGYNQSMKIVAVEEKNTKHILSMVKGQRQGKNRRRARPATRGQNRGGKRRGGGRSRSAHDDNYSDSRAGRFSRGSFNNDRNRFAGRGASNNRNHFYDSSQDQRPMSMSRSNSGTFQQNSKKRSNTPTFGPPARAQPQQQQKPNVSVTMKPLPATYPGKAPTNDRRVQNESVSIRVTVQASNNYRREISQEDVSNSRKNPPIERGSSVVSHSSDADSKYDEDEYNEDENDDDERVLVNLRSLLTEYPYGVRLLALDNLYRNKFGKSLLAELRISNILLLQEFVEDFATISRHGEENGSCDHIITLKDPDEVAETQAASLRKITNSGMVPSSFFYATNLISYVKDTQFQGYVSDVDKSEHCLHIQPARYRGHIEALMEELNSYYSNPISNQWIVNRVETGLACVTKFHDVYHRAFIKESDSFRCVILYVDYGTTEEVNKTDREFKYLLNHFAELPCMTLSCRLDDVFFLPHDHQWSPEAYQEIISLCQGGPYFIEHMGMRDGLLTVRILDADHQCLNDMIIDLKLAVRLSTMEQFSIENNRPNQPKPVSLNFDYIDTAVHCPLPPDSDPSTPDYESSDNQKQFSEFVALSYPSVERRYKLIIVDDQFAFHLIQSDTNTPCITCFDLSQLLNQSESDILSETLLSRIRINRTAEYLSAFDYIARSDPKHCPHFHQQNLFIFELKSVIDYLKKTQHQNLFNLITLFEEQIEASKRTDYWNTIENRCPFPSLNVANSVANQTDIERYQALLQRRRTILSNIARMAQVDQPMSELETIENELRQLINRMRLGDFNDLSSQISSTPSPYLHGSTKTDRSQSLGTDKLKDLMQRCKTLINTILTFDDYVAIGDDVIEYIQMNLPYLNSDKRSSNEDQLFVEYSKLLENLTMIVNDLRKRLPIGVDVA